MENYYYFTYKYLHLGQDAGGCGWTSTDCKYFPIVDMREYISNKYKVPYKSVIVLNWTEILQEQFDELQDRQT